MLTTNHICMYAHVPIIRFFTANVSS